MAQKMTGALVFDERTDRYDIRFDLNSYYGGLHCGECFDVFVRGKWKPTRIEYGDNWYLVGTALIGYIWYEAPEDEKNFTTLLEMINASEAREDDEDFQNPVDLMFERLEEKDPEHFAVKQYKKYKLAAGDICSK